MSEDDLLCHHAAVVSPGVEEHLAPAVEGEVELDLVPPRSHEAPHRAGLGLAEGRLAAVLLAAGVGAAACSVSSVPRLHDIDRHHPPLPPHLKLKLRLRSTPAHLPLSL